MENKEIKQYEKYKNSGISWIGEIPEHWEVKKLKYEFRWEKGKNASLYTNEYIGFNRGIYPVFSGQTENNGILGFINTYDYEFVNPVILVTTVGAKAMTIKKVNGKFALSQNCALIVPKNSQTDTRYYFFYLQQYFEFEKGMISLIMQPSLRFEDLNKYFIILPPKDEQVAIANYLNRKTAEIDELIAKKERLLEHYEEEKKAIINKTVTKGINPNVKIKDSGIPWLGEIPEHWEVKRLKYVAKFILTGKTPPSNKGEYFDGKINWFTPGDFNDESLFLKESKRKITEIAIEKAGIKLYPPKTILLVGIGATLGKIACVEKEATSNQQINAILFNESEINFKFGLYFLFSFKEAIIRFANAATLSIFNQSQTKDFYIFVPPIGEQQQIVSYIEKQISIIDLKIEKTKKVIELLKEYKTSLISEVVTGKRKVI